MFATTASKCKQKIFKTYFDFSGYQLLELGGRFNSFNKQIKTITAAVRTTMHGMLRYKA